MLSEYPGEMRPFPQLEQFRLIVELGKGARGTAYRARRLIEQDVVAVKVFDELYSSDAAFAARLTQAAERAFLLEHPGIVRVLGCLVDSGRLCLAMEYVPGEDLARALQRNVRFTPERTITIAQQLARALAYAKNRGQVHGALHPGNVILQDSVARLVGVGLGETLPARGGGKAIFCPYIYAAPERATGATSVGEAPEAAAGDLYSFGGILYHMLTGHSPWRADSLEALRRERESGFPHWPRGAEQVVPQPLVDLVNRCMCPDPGGRPSGYESVLVELEAASRATGGGFHPVERGSRSATAARSASPVAARVRKARGRPCTPAPLEAAPKPPPGPETDGPARTWPFVLATLVVFLLAVGLGARTLLWPPPEKKDLASEPPLATNQESAAAAHQPAEEARKFLDFLERQLTSFNGETGADADKLRDLVQMAALYTQPPHPAEVRQRALQLKWKTDALLKQVLGKKEERDQPRRPEPDREEVLRRAYQEVLDQARLKAADDYFGEAVKILSADVAPLKGSEREGQLKLQGREFERQARARMDEVLADARLLEQKGMIEESIALLERLRERLGIPTYVAVLDREIAAYRDQRDAAAQRAKNEERQKHLERLGTAWPPTAQALLEQVQNFHYPAALAELAKFETLDVEGQYKSRSAGAREAIQAEQALFTLARERLRSGQVSPPLQVQDESRAQGWDIIDFNDGGIRVRLVSKTGSGSAEQVYRWSYFRKEDHYNLLKNAAEVKSAEDQLGLAAFCFFRGMTIEMDNHLKVAVAIDPNAKDQAARLRAAFAATDQAVLRRERPEALPPPRD